MVLIEAHLTVAGWAEQMKATLCRIGSDLAAGNTQLWLSMYHRKHARMAERANDLINGTTFLTEVSAPNLQVRRHDVVTEDFPLRSFDLIHARWLLVNVPQREEVLRKIVSWLAPGGWLVTEDVEFSPVDSSPHPPVQRLMNAFEQLLADSHGADFRWGRRRLPTALAEAGLVELGMSMSVKCVGDGGPAEAFYRSSMSQARDGLVGLGLLSEAEYTAGIATLDDPAVIDTPIANLAAWGRATER